MDIISEHKYKTDEKDEFHNTYNYHHKNEAKVSGTGSFNTFCELIPIISYLDQELSTHAGSHYV